jgi:amino acid adenylation domain-containing protein
LSNDNTKENIEAIYPLSPMQEGMLFHYLSEPDSGAYFEQYTCTYKGAISSDALKRAWQKVVDCNPILRTLVIWERKDRPLQVVRKDATLEWYEEDCSTESEAGRAEKIKVFLQQDLDRGFNLKQAPLMRMALLKLSDDEYYFVWSFHHLLLDGWSSPLLFNSVFALYQAYKEGKDLELKETPPYRNYIAWLQKQDMVKAEAYWKKTLQGFSSPTKLNVSGPEVNSNTTSFYEKLSVNLSSQASVALSELSRQHQLTLNSVVQGAWAYLLSCYSGESDVVFGSTVSGRPAELPGVVEMVGLFINTLPVRVKINSEVPVFEWLKTLQAEQLESKDYEYSPLVDIQKWSEVPRRQALFDSILIFENYPNVDSEESSLGFTINNEHTREQTNYPLTIGVEPDNNFLLNCIFDCTQYDAETIAGLLGHFKNILENIAEYNDKPINYKTILMNAEIQLFESWNQTNSDYPDDVCLHQLTAEQARSSADKIAISFNGLDISFQQLDEKANKLSHYLIAQGVKVNDLVGLCVERSIDMVVSMLAIHKAGAAYLPLDPEYPSDRIAFILDDANVGILLTEFELQDQLSECSSQLIFLDKETESIEQCKSVAPETDVTADSIAYVIYTSGSTGKPKGVQVPHKSVVNFLYGMKTRPGILSDDVLLAVTTLAFDIAVLELFLPLITGARIELADREVASDGRVLLERINQSGVTMMQATPATWRLMLAAGWNESDDNYTENLKVLCGGEAMPADLAADLLSRVASVWNMYGPTETTVWSTVYQVTDADKPIMIGKPIANTDIYIVDCNMHDQPVGVAGELYIGGSGVTRGYLNRDSLTKERFVNHASGRLYRTGDLVRYHSDGNIEYINRLDNQVKVRGFRIEPGEIESVLSQHENIDQAVVLIREDQPGDTRLVAYYLTDNDDLSTTQLRKHLRTHLPDYMIPQHFVQLEELPVTPNGKIDRLALPAPFNTGVSDDQYVAPRTDNEKFLAAIWQDVLKVDRVGAYDNFFELGGHSLLSMQVITRLKDETGLKLELRAMVMDTLEQIAAQYAEVEAVDISEEEASASGSGGFLTKLKQRFIPKKESK